MQLKERLEITRNLIWEANTHQDFLEYLAYDLHNTPSKIAENSGLHFLWRSVMAIQIITLNKILKVDEAFSLSKLINIGGTKIKGFNKAEFQEEFDYVLGEYEKNQLDVARDQFIAHLDLSANEVKTDIHMHLVVTNLATFLFNKLSIAFGAEKYRHSDNCIGAFREIFEKLEDYENIKAIISLAKSKGEESIKIESFSATKC